MLYYFMISYILYFVKLGDPERCHNLLGWAVAIMLYYKAQS